MGVPARAAVEAPEGGRASDNGAQPRPRYQQAATFVDAARQMVGMRLSALRLPPGRRRTLKRGAAKLGRYRVARTISFIRPRAVKRSGGGQPPCGIADAPHRGSRGRNGDRRPPMPPSPLRGAGCAYNAATAATSTSKSSRTRRSTTRSVFGGKAPLGNRRENSRAR